MILETTRLILREMTQEDFPSLCKMLQDKDVMYAYEHSFSDKEAHEWLDRQITRYSDYGFGLWGVDLKETGEMIGQCGLTMQDCNDSQVLEVGYLFTKAYWHQGFAAESAIACKNYAFNRLNFDKVYSIIRDNNISSQKVALQNGMTKIGELTKHYYGMDMLHFIFMVEDSIKHR